MVIAAELDLRDASPKFRERFWSKVDIRGDDECWPWTKSLYPDTGYGQFLLRTGRPMAANRVALALTVGVVPEGKNACHTCDNRPCCNPRHLFPGTQAENVADMIAKGRARKVHGEDRPHKLTAADVLDIRARRASGEGQRVLAREYGVSHTLVGQLERRERWAHV